ncbi:MAG: HDIG domain-containing protein, partial [Chloroflexi bacterium]|nr:HDIG domain-containing protein [Chloroflexota bacterium]
IGDLLDDLLRPTLSPDPAATERARQAAANAVPPATVALTRGETVIRDGEIIGPGDLEKLQAAGLTPRGLRLRELVGAGLISLAMSSVLLLFLARRQMDVAGAPMRPTPRRLFLLGAVIAGTTAAAKLLLPQYPEWVYAFPLAAGPMLLAVLMDGALAVLAAALLSLLAAYAAGYAPEVGGFVGLNALDLLERVTFFFVGSVAGVLAALRTRRLPQFFVAGAAVSAAGLLILLGFWLLSPAPTGSLSIAAAATLGNGLLAATLAVAAFVAAGQLFGVTTSIQLAELAQSQHPLMRRLIAEAPGTYYHSLLVGNLAERAAEAVEADALLTRVGAYYHDIGKLANPGVFIENHRSADSPHDHLDPQSSAALITAHVKDGLRLADEYRLPARIRDFIAMHHGTRMAVFFYHQATQRRAPGEPPPDPKDFSYAGPRPRSKETALVMLADSLEAATRSLGRPSAADIDELVDRLVNERVAEGQLDDSDLTLRDLEHAKVAFKEGLQGIFHPRIAYPRDVPG